MFRQASLQRADRQRATPNLPEDCAKIIFQYYNPLEERRRLIHFSEGNGMTDVDDDNPPRVYVRSVDLDALFYMVRLERIFFDTLGFPTTRMPGYRNAILSVNWFVNEGYSVDTCPDIALAVRNQNPQVKYLSRYYFENDEEGRLLIAAASRMPRQGCGQEQYEEYGYSSPREDRYMYGW